MFVKMFASMYEGTLGTRGPWEALVTFQQLLILADRFGVVDMTSEVISRRTLIPHEIIVKGIEHLMQPDPHSRRKEEEGRRIVPFDPERSWGWRIVNFDFYRKLQRHQDRRDYHSDYMRDYRQGKRRTEEKPADIVPDDSPLVESLPLISGASYHVTEQFAAELEPLYPLVDVRGSLREMKGWLIGNPTRRKTARGIRKFVTAWLARENDRYTREQQEATQQ